MGRLQPAARGRWSQAFHARGVPVCNVYGATETGPFSIALPPQHAAQPRGLLRLAGARRGGARWAPCRTASANCWCAGPTWSARYWPDQPACDAEGWFHTGDLAAQAHDGSYTVVGRAKDLIISGGENIHPAEIESVLAEHPAVAECAAFGMPDAQWGEVVAVAVVLQARAARVREELRAHLAGRLARYKLPRRWLWLGGAAEDGAGQGAAAGAGCSWRVHCPTR